MTLLTKHHVIKAERAETVQSYIVGYYPRSKLPFSGITPNDRAHANVLVKLPSYFVYNFAR